MPLRTELAFPHDYDAEQLRELPGAPPANEPVLYFPGGSTTGGTDGLILRFALRDGSDWTGVFAFGRLSPKSGVFSSPDPSLAVVLATGIAYAVDIQQRRADVLPEMPVVDVRAVVSEMLLLLLTPTHIGAYGVNGHAWATQRLSFDGIEISDIDSGYLTGLAFDPRLEEKVSFRVDLRTGLHQGGASPDE